MDGGGLAQYDGPVDELRNRLTKDLAEVGWRDLRTHAGRGVLFLWTGQTPLVDAAIAVAKDDKSAVESWLEQGQLARPTAAQLSAWEEELDRPFEFVIVQPFVLARCVEH